jgi:S-adenosylmethionine:tRNA ribosyltransferase-isomerase
LETSNFTYELPNDAIAQTAIEPRDASRLLVVPELTDHVFADLPELLEPGDLLVVNRTRVRAARLACRRVDTGGRVELLLLRRVDEARWEALARPSRRLRPGVELDAAGLVAHVMSEPLEGVVTVTLEAGAGDLEQVIAAVGTVPLPPYFHGMLDDPERYQTMFATTVGSAAAPTAALHFTPGVVEALHERGVHIAEVELEVGLDTFRPISSPTIEEHSMHRERYVVPEATAAAVKAARTAGHRIVAVGTTVVRTLESAAADRGVAATSGSTDLFITPGYRFRVVDAMLTNFHAPGTTLIVMMAAVLGDAWRDIYETALRRGYRFLSFGDAMLITDMSKPDR